MNTGWRKLRREEWHSRPPDVFFADDNLTSQILNDLLEQTPSKNVGRITVLNGLSGRDQAIVSRQGVLQGK